jgi:hypothetical protein
MSPRNQKLKQAKRQNPHVLNEMLEHRMLWYVLAAGATLAGASAAQAKVVFTPSNVVLTPGHQHTNRLHIDLNNDGTVDFVLTDYSAASTSFNKSYFLLRVAARQPLNAILMSSPNGYPSAAALKRGTSIGSSGKFGSHEDMAFKEVINSGGGTNSDGNFLNVTNRYLGVKFMINGELHYGWIGFRSVDGFTAKLAGWAYETEPNQPILAGGMGEQGSESDSVTLRSVEPTSLELLAAGNIAIDAWRRRIAN